MKNTNIHNDCYQKTRKIRIIGGKWRGKKITVTPHPELRPTTNQIRETLFNWLIPVITGANCLDCFAGSGALGLEALSRSAQTVTFLEKNKIISYALNNTIEILQIRKKTKVITTNSIKWLTSSHYYTKPYDIVFIDPPFSKSYYIQNILKLLDNKFKYLSKNAWIYIENKNIPTLSPTIPSTWKLHKKKLQKPLFIKFISNIN